MKLAVFSDFHFGFAKKTLRENECYENALQCFNFALENNADAILLAGDFFDEPVPSPEVLEKSFEVFGEAKKKKSNATITILKKEQKQKVSFEGTPVIVVAGTHEYRGKEYTNIVDLLVKAGLCIRLHASVALIEKENEKIAIHGLSGIPEKFALELMKQWNPIPIENAKNFLMMHQSIKEFLPFEDEMTATISMNDLPKGFDLIINGHLHWSSIHTFEGGKLLLTGSTITTQMKKLEAEKPKGLHIIQTPSLEITFIPIKNQRRLFYHKEDFKNANPSEIIEKVKKLIENDLQTKTEKPPLIRIKLTGSLSKGVDQTDIDIEKILREHEGKAIFSISKNFFSETFTKKISELRELQRQKKSVTSIGFELLEKNLSQTEFNNAFDAKTIFDLLAEGETEKVIELLSKN
jgi:DNA repair exonuclease SbcCD nuclease subunit